MKSDRQDEGASAGGGKGAESAHLGLHTPRDLLPDLSQFQHKAMEWLARNRGAPFTLLLVYVDDIRGVNEGLGYATGQQLLREASDRIQNRLPAGSLVGNLVAGYLVVLTPVAAGSNLERLCQLITQTMNVPLKLDLSPVQTSASAGAACFPQHGKLLPDLFRRSMMALSYARRRGGNRFRVYDEEMGQLVRERWQMGSRLRGAAEREEFHLVYQPHVDAATGRITGAEALMRWNDAEHGPQSPAEFVPLLEQAALILPVGLWVLRTACAQAKAWEAAGLADITLSVNLSPRQIEHDDLVTDVAAVLDDTGLAPQKLVLEITENMLLRDVDHTRSAIEELSVLGVRVVMDDFGTGYSSMSYLKHLPLWGIKLDRSFVSGLPDQRNDVEIAEAIIGLAGRLKLAVIAEGAETPEQVRFLRERGVTSIQGWHYSPAVEPEKFAELLRQQPFKPA